MRALNYSLGINRGCELSFGNKSLGTLLGDSSRQNNFFLEKFEES